jgi:conjugal transfer mating pair stabilization protein TraG
MTKLAQSAEDIMLQQMLIRSTMDAIETKSTSLGNAPNVAVRRAYLQQRATQETLAGIAAQKLIAMKNVMEALIYVAFIFLLPMALLPLGWSFISQWVGLLLWVQLWPPLYAILNFIMQLSLRLKGSGAIETAGGITIANVVGFTNLHADMAAQAGFMTIAVGALSYALVKGGAASFIHLASHLGGPAMGAASNAAESMTSGNYNFGNVSTGNIQSSSQSFGQQTLSPSYNSGAFSQGDGMVSRTTSESGHMVGVQSSSLRSNVQFSESLSQSYTDQATKAQQLAESKMQASAESLTEANRNLLDLSEHQAKQTSLQESHGQSTSTSSTQAFTKLDNLVDRFAKDHSITREGARQWISSASVSSSAGTGFNLLVASASTNGSISTTGQYNSTKATRDLFSAAQDYTKQKSFQTALSEAKQASHDLRQSELSDTGKRLVSSFNASSEKAESLRKEASQHLQKSESYSHMASWTKQNAGSLSANLNQEYVGWLQKQSLPNSKGSMGIREAETILSARPSLDTAYQRRFMEEKMGSFKAGGLPISPETLSSRFKTSSLSAPSGKSLGNLKSKASKQGFNPVSQENRRIITKVEEDMSQSQKTLTTSKEAVTQEKEKRYGYVKRKTKT